MNSPVSLGGEFALKPLSPEFLFVPETHVYTLGGVVLPSFSEVVRICGYVDTSFYKPEHRIRGTNVHDGIRLVNKGKLDWSDLGDAYFGYILAYEKLMREWNIKPQLYEMPLYHPDLLYGVTPDLICTVLRNIPAIFEFKTGAVDKCLVSKQTAAQAMAVRTWEVNPVYRRRWGVTLNADGTYEKPIEFVDPMDETVFKGNLITAKDKIKYGKGV